MWKEECGDKRVKQISLLKECFLQIDSVSNGMQRRVLNGNNTPVILITDGI
jgi:hypothetical protein